MTCTWSIIFVFSHAQHLTDCALEEIGRLRDDMILCVSLVVECQSGEIWEWCWHWYLFHLCNENYGWRDSSWCGNEGGMKWTEKKQRKWNDFIDTRVGVMEMNEINCMDWNNGKEDDWEGGCEWDKEMIEDDVMREGEVWLLDVRLWWDLMRDWELECGECETEWFEEAE